MLAYTPTLTTGDVDREHPTMKTDLFKQILEHSANPGLNINIRGIHGDTSLHYASLEHVSKDWKIMDFLPRLDADVLSNHAIRR